MRRRTFVRSLLIALLAVSAAAQSPRLTSVEPANGKAGEELVTAGQSLDDSKVADLLFPR